MSDRGVDVAAVYLLLREVADTVLRLDGKFTAIDRRFDVMDRKFEALERKVEDPGSGRQGCGGP